MPKILLVEDNELNRDMLSRRLARKGYEVLIAEDGAEGWRWQPRERPDLVLMDMSLPVMDGWEATRRLKADAADAGHPGHRPDRARHVERPAKRPWQRAATTTTPSRSSWTGCSRRSSVFSGRRQREPGWPSDRDGRTERLLRDGPSDKRARLAHVRQELLAPVKAIAGYADILRDEDSRLGLEHWCRISTGFWQPPRPCSSLSRASWMLRPRRLASRPDEPGRHPGTPASRPAHPAERHQGLWRVAARGPWRSWRVRLRQDLEQLLAESARLLANLDVIVDFSGHDAPPAEAEAERPASWSPTSLRDGTAAQTLHRSESRETGKILVVDDNASNRDLLRRRLSREGHQALEAASGRKALEMLDDRRRRPRPARPDHARHERA